MKTKPRPVNRSSGHDMAREKCGAPDNDAPAQLVRPDHDSSAEPTPDIVLFAVTGMSPAVLTETVWALAHEPESIIPSRVIVATTARGRGVIEGQLFAASPRFDGLSPWDALRSTLSSEGYDLTGRLRFGTTADDIRIITGIDGVTGRTCELEDIRTPADNAAAADFLLEQIRAIVENPDTQLIASVAGGRKTMGALLYACLCLVGRDTDRLTHVLVSEPFETLREFWFPGQPGGLILQSAIHNSQSPGSNPQSAIRNPQSPTSLHPSEARVELADVPFVALRNLFQRELGRKAGTFSRLVETCREHVRHRTAENLQVTVDASRPEIEINGQGLRLAPLEQLLMLFLARRAKQGEPPFGTYLDAVDALNAFRLELLQTIPKNDYSDWRHADSLRGAWDEEEIRKAASSIRAKLRQRGGDAAVLAACLPEKGRCSLDVSGPLIHIK